MREEQEAYQLTAESAKKYEEKLSVPDAAIQIEKFAEEVSRIDLQVSVAPETDEDHAAAQRIEDAAYWWIREVQSRHVQCIRAPFKYEAAHYLAHRGWLAAECLVNPDDRGFPWTLRLLDPIDVYPDRDAGEPGVIVHRYLSSLAQLESYWGKDRLEAARATTTAHNDFAHLSSETVTCYGYYTPTEMAVLLEGGGWLKEPVAHGYGRNPLVLAVAPGAPYRKTQAGSTDHIAMVGPGLLRTILDVIRDKRRVGMRVMRMLTRTAAPGLFYATSDPEATADDVSTDPNSVTVGRQGDSLTPVVPPPVAFQYATGLLSMLQDAENRGGIGPALFGEGSPGSGYDRTKQIGTSLSKLEVYLETLGFWYEALLKLMLRQFAYFGGPDLQYLAVNRTTGLRTAANRLSPFDVVGADVRLEVRFGNLQNVDKMQMGTLAAQLIDRGVVDPEYALGELLKVDNPTAIIRRATKYQGFKDPDILRLRVLSEMAQDTEDPLQQLWGMAFEAQAQKFVLGLQPPPPGPPPGQPPIAGVGAPSAALPDELGPNAGMPPNVAALGYPQPGAAVQPIAPPPF